MIYNRIYSYIFLRSHCSQVSNKRHYLRCSAYYKGCLFEARPYQRKYGTLYFDSRLCRRKAVLVCNGYISLRQRGTFTGYLGLNFHILFTGFYYSKAFNFQNKLAIAYAKGCPLPLFFKKKYKKKIRENLQISTSSVLNKTNTT